MFCKFQGIIQLEKELAYLGSVCAAALMKKDLALPIGTEKSKISAFEAAFCITHIIMIQSFVGNELEEDLEILEEASLQVYRLLS